MALIAVNVSASHAVDLGFASQPGPTKDQYKNGTNCLPDWYTDFRVGVWLCNPTM